MKDADIANLVDEVVSIGDVPVCIESKDLSCPGYFLTRVAKSEYPLVVLPDGKVIRPRNNSNEQGYFSWEIARIYAERNNGILLRSGIEDRRFRAFPYKDYIEAVKRLAPNAKTIKESARDDATFNRLSEESAFLKNVTPWHTRDVLASMGMLVGGYELSGIRGNITGENGEIRYGHKENACPITLCLFLGGFGYSHFEIEGRRLIAEIRTNPLDARNRRSASEIEATKTYCGNRYEEGIFWAYKEEESEKFVLGMDSPRQINCNSNLEKEVLSTQHMLEKFVPLVEVVSGAFVKMDDKLRKSQSVELEGNLGIFRDLEAERD